MRLTFSLLLVVASLFLCAITFSVSASQQLVACQTDECKEYFKAYKILSKRGHSQAMAVLAEFYYVGYGTDQDTDDALKWYKRAGKYGVLTAKYKAGVIYLQKGKNHDVNEGVDLLEQVSRRSFSPSALLLGKLYLGGGLVETDMAKADKYLSQAYELGNTSAITYASLLYKDNETQNLDLPKLYALVQADIETKTPEASVVSSNETIQFPVGEMETISVTNDSFEELFRAQIATLNNTIPDTSKGTGSNIAGQTCADMWGCSVEGDGLRIRDVLLSDWGLETLSFRSF